MRGVLLALIYIVTSAYIGVNQYMDMGHLSMTFKVVTGIAFVVFMILNLKLQNPQNLAVESQGCRKSRTS